MKISIDGPEKPIEKTEDALEREAIKKTFSGEKKKLAAMNFSGKIKYIFGYYKFHILGILLAVLVICYGISLFVNRTDSVIMIVSINSYNTRSEEFSSALSEYLGLEGRQVVDYSDDLNLSYTGVSNTINRSNYSGSTQLMCYVAASELDCTFSDQSGFDYLKSQELTKDILPLLSDTQKAAFEKMLVYDNERVIAIDLTGTNFASLLGLTGEKEYLCIQNLSGHEDNIKGFLQFLYETQFTSSPITF